jgi:hypothetical protein
VRTNYGRTQVRSAALEQRTRSVINAIRKNKCGKILSEGERKLIHDNHMNIGVVFQHRNSCERTWRDSKRATYDADRALAMAQQLSQPKGTAIYFGVDGADQNFKEHRKLEEGVGLIKSYFAVVSKKLKSAGYEVGVYGSGLSCRILRDEERSVKYCWLSMSPGHPESRDFEPHKTWDIKQCVHTRLPGYPSLEYDPDILNASKNDFGLRKQTKSRFVFNRSISCCGDEVWTFAREGRRLRVACVSETVDGLLGGH